MMDAPKSIQSWLTHDVYLMAETVLKVPGKLERQIALAKINELVRPYVEAEVMRLWRLSRRS